MIRTLLYTLLVLSAVPGLWLILVKCRHVTPRIMAITPALTVSLAYGLYMLARSFWFWAGGNWWQEPPVAPYLAVMANSVILAWAFTGLLLAFDCRVEDNVFR